MLYNQNDLLTISQAAAFVGVSGNTLRNWDKKGKLRAFRHPVNNFRLYKEEDLKTLLSLIEQYAIKPDHEKTSEVE